MSSTARLPLELISDIRDLVLDEPGEASVWSLVQRVHRRPAQRLLFRHVRHQVNAPDTSAPTLEDLVHENPAVAELVENLSLEVVGATGDTRLRLSLLRWMRNVASVSVNIKEQLGEAKLRSVLAAVCDLMQRCGSSTLRISGTVSWSALPLSWILRLPRLRDLTIRRAGCSYSRDPEFGWDSVVLRSPLSQAEEFREDVRQLVTERVGQGVFGAGLLDVLLHDDLFLEEDRQVLVDGHTADTPHEIGAVSRVDLDERSAESLASLLFQSTNATSLVSFCHLEELSLRGQCATIVRLAQVLCHASSQSLRRVHWAFLGQWYVSPFEELPPRLRLPPRLEKITFDFTPHWPTSTILEVAVPVISSLLDLTPPPRIDILIARSEQISWSGDLELLTTLRQMIPHARLDEAVKVKSVVVASRWSAEDSD